MYFNLPFRGMYRPPRPGHKSIAERRIEGQKAAQLVAKEMSNNADIQANWAAGDEDAVLAACTERALRIGDAAYVSPTMIFNSLKGHLRG